MADMGLDFETYGTRDLKKVGLANYLDDPEFRPLIASAVWRDGNGKITITDFDFVSDPVHARNYLRDCIGDMGGVAVHNAGFERGVLNRIGIHLPHARFMDTAVLSRIRGADTRLSNAAPQLLMGAKKMSEGKGLIKRFSVPNKVGLSDAVELHKLGQLETNDDWMQFKMYCSSDAELAYLLAEDDNSFITPREQKFEVLTQRMNGVGWHVDLDAVREMQFLYEQNKADLLKAFQDEHDPTGALNLNSLKQLKEWCRVRGVNATSFDEQHVAKLYERVETKLIQMNLAPGSTVPPAIEPLKAVFDLLKVKKALGGSSLKKLQVILDMVSEDGRLRNSYMHYGASQTGRTTGKGVQMQNLPRLHGAGDDMSTLTQANVNWTNEALSANLRQVFCASSTSGFLVVGDFASIESRALAYVAGETWKLDAYVAGQDVYKAQAAKIFNRSYVDVTKDQRQVGKVGELSCGYGAGPSAVQSFAKKMGVPLTEQEAGSLVTDWRDVNGHTVAFWENMNTALHLAVTTRTQQNVMMEHGLIRLRPISTPMSLLDIHPGAVSIEMAASVEGFHFNRVFHGCYTRGRNICYYKPSGKAGGDLWSPQFTDPKTKGRKFHNLYGGKLTGILIQSLCREVFFDVMSEVSEWCDATHGVQLIGQFHDELVLEFTPQGGFALHEVEEAVKRLMSHTRKLPGFPLNAEVKSAYRYIK